MAFPSHKNLDTEWSLTPKNWVHWRKSITSAYTLRSSQSGMCIDNQGAAASVTVTLPSGCRNGVNYQFEVYASQNLVITPAAADAIYFNGALLTAGYYVTLIGISTLAVLERINKNSGYWAVTDWNGVVTAQSGS